MTAPVSTVFVVSVPTFELGPQGRILRLAKGWAARGHPTVIAALQGESERGARERTYDAVPIEMLTRRGKEALEGMHLESQRAIRAFVEQRKPKLVFALETLVDWHVKLALMDRPEPVVTLLGVDRWKWERKAYRRTGFRAMAKRTNALIANSKSCLDGYRRALGPKYVDPIPKAVVHNPVDPDEFDPLFDRSPKELVIGGLGRLADQKGFDILIQAFARLPREIAGRPIKLRIQGEGPERRQLTELAASLGVEDRVAFPGHTSDVQGFFDSIAVFAMPSRWAGFENAALEALLAGVPTICTPETGLNELKDSRALIFARGERDDLARALLDLLARNDAQRAEIARAQHGIILAQLHLDRIANDLEKTLIELRVLSSR